MPIRFSRRNSALLAWWLLPWLVTAGQVAVPPTASAAPDPSSANAASAMAPRGEAAATVGPTVTETAFARDVRAAGVPGATLARLQHGIIGPIETVGQVTADSRFLWGSVSKPLAASIAVSLAERGLLDLDAPVSRYSGGALHAPVRSLLDHTSGLGFGADHLDVDRPDATAAHVAPALPEEATGPAAYRYSSLGYLHLQAVLERASGRPYGEAVRAHLPGTGVGADAASCRDLAQPHRLTGPWAWPLPSPYDGAGAAYGYTCGNVRDLAEFAVAHLRSPDVGELTPTGSPGQGYARGWRVTTEADGRTTHWHTGTAPGYFSAVYLDPGSGDGVAVLLDSSGYLHEERLAAVTRAAYDRVTGRAPVTIPDTPMAIIVPLTLAAGGVGLGVAAVARRPRSRRTQRAWVAGLGSLLAAIAVGPPLAGYPQRYVWLWEPGVAVAAGGLVAAAAAGVVLSAVRLRGAARARQGDSV